MWAWLLVACSGTAPVDEAAPDPRLEGPAAVSVERLTMDLGARDGFPPQVPLAAYVPDPGSFDGAETPVVWFSGSSGVDAGAWHDTLVHLASWGLLVLAPTWDSVANPRTHRGLAGDLVAATRWLRTTAVPELDPDLDRQAASGVGRGAKVATLAASEAALSALWLADPDGGAPDDGEEWPAVTPALLDALPATGLVATGGAEGFPPCVDPALGWDLFLPGADHAWRLEDAGGADLVDACVGGTGGLACVCGAGARPGEALSAARGWQVALLRVELAGDDALAGWLDDALYAAEARRAPTSSSRRPPRRP